jgi:hypothetical protein
VITCDHCKRTTGDDKVRRYVIDIRLVNVREDDSLRSMDTGRRIDLCADCVPQVMHALDLKARETPPMPMEARRA